MVNISTPNARVNITWKGQNDDLPDEVLFDLSDDEIKKIVQESISSGSVPGINQDESADFSNFVVDRFSADANTSINRIVVRSKTPFGF